MNLLPVNLDAIPAGLKERPQWLLWQAEARADGKVDKLPTNPTSGRVRVSAHDPANWTSFDRACRGMKLHNATGLGFKPVADGNIIGLDLDNAIDPATGEIAQWAESLLTRFASTYAERSPSGKGFRIWGLGRLPEGADRKRKGNVEIYDGNGGNFLTVTGQRWPGSAEDLADITAEVAALYAELFPPQKAARPTSGNISRSSLSLSDADLLAKAMEHANFAALFRGDLSAVGGDESAADYRLCWYLAFWTGGDAERIDRLFRQSALYRDKWERNDYRQRTIEEAMSRQTEHYEPGLQMANNWARFDADADAKNDNVSDPEKLVDTEIENSRQNEGGKFHDVVKFEGSKIAFSSVAEWERYGQRLAKAKTNFDEEFRWRVGAWYNGLTVEHGGKMKFCRKKFGDDLARQIIYHYAPTVAGWGEQGRQEGISFGHHEALIGEEPKEREYWCQEIRQRAKLKAEGKAKEGLTVKELRTLLGNGPSKKPAKGWAMPKAEGIGDDIAEMLGELGALLGGNEATQAIKPFLRELLEKARDRKAPEKHDLADDGIRWSDEELHASAVDHIEKQERQRLLDEADAEETETETPDFSPDIPDDLADEAEESLSPSPTCVYNTDFSLQELEVSPFQSPGGTLAPFRSLILAAQKGNLPLRRFAFGNYVVSASDLREWVLSTATDVMNMHTAGMTAAQLKEHLERLRIVSDWWQGESGEIDLTHAVVERRPVLAMVGGGDDEEGWQ